METLIWDKQESIGVLTFNRPQALNAANPKMIGELFTWAQEAAKDKTLRVVILTGSGDKAFIAGADIKEMNSFSPEQGRIFSENGHRALSAVLTLPVPVIAAVNGFALGGGCEIAMAGDFILASEKASFGLPEVTLGLIPGFGGTQRLPQFVGTARAAEMIFSGRRYSAQEALQFGLVNSVYPAAELMPAAKKLAGEIASRGPMAVTATKRILLETAHLSLKDGLVLEQKAFASMFATQDQKEGTQAFIDKRPAQFKGS